MSVETHSEDAPSQPPVARGRAAVVAVLAWLVAAAPHFFLDTPLGFYAQQNLDAWLGLTVWAPTFLGAIALFMGADAGARTPRPLVHSLDVRLAAAVAAPVVGAAALAAVEFDGYQHVGPWSKIGLAMAVYAGVFAVGCLYWQGIVQRRVLAGVPAVVRAVVVAAAGAALWLPFVIGHSWSSIAPTLAEYAIVYGLVAVLFEFGLSVLACMAVALVLGIGWAWAHQMVFY